MTEKAELDRIRAIHAALDNWSKGNLRRSRAFWIELEGHARVDFTVDEVRAWPEMKARLRDHFRVMTGHNRAVWYGGASGWAMGNADEHPPKSNSRGLENYARGLCLYREMLDDAQPEAIVVTDTRIAGPSSFAPGSAGLRLNVEQWEALGRRERLGTDLRLNEEQREALKVDPYAEHTAWERTLDIRHATDIRPINEQARKRNVARLRREMDEGESRRAALVGLVHPVTNRALGRMR